MNNMHKTKRLAAVGFCCADIYENLNLWYPTGNGIDWGIHLSRMGYPVSAVSVVGNDVYGEGMRQMLTKEGLDVSHLRVEEGSTCITRMALKNGTDRVHLETVDGVMADYRLSAEDLAFVAEHDLIHTDLFGNCLGHLPEWKRQGIKIVMDFSVFSRDPEYRCEELFPYVDYVFFSADQIPSSELEDWMKKIASYGPVLVTATLGEAGSLCFDGKCMHRHGITEVAEPVNTVGAGDSYIAGFTAGLLEGASIEECMERGARLAASVIGLFRPY